MDRSLWPDAVAILDSGVLLPGNPDGGPAKLPPQDERFLGYSFAKDTLFEFYLTLLHLLGERQIVQVPFAFYRPEVSIVNGHQIQSKSLIFEQEKRIVAPPNESFFARIIDNLHSAARMPYVEAVTAFPFISSCDYSPEDQSAIVSVFLQDGNAPPSPAFYCCVIDGNIVYYPYNGFKAGDFAR